MPSALHVGIVTASQHESLVDLLRELHAYYDAGPSMPRAAVRSYLDDCLLAPDSPLRLVVAADQAGRVVGLAAIMLTWSLVEHAPDRRRQCWLKELYVLSSSRGTGVGRALMTWVARYAVDNGCARIDWPVNAANATGIAFYERLGARPVDERRSYRLAGPAMRALADS
jgi:GNAT superfamily N-acetyltransferase